MVNLFARYQVKADKLNEVKMIVSNFVELVKNNEPKTLKYEAFQEKNNPNEFVHFISFKDESAEEFHRNTEYVKKFIDALYPLCEKKPVFTHINKVE